jgi:hypothetical protein
MPDILPELFKPDEAALVAILLFRLLDAAKATTRSRPSLIRTEPLPAKLIFQHREMRSHFFGQRTVGFAAPGE